MTISLPRRAPARRLQRVVPYITPVCWGIAGGGFFASWPGVVVGALAGAALVWRRRLLALAAASGVVAVAIATIAEGSRAVEDSPRYALERPLAHALGLGVAIIWMATAFSIGSQEGAVTVDRQVALHREAAPGRRRSVLVLLALVTLFAGLAGALVTDGIGAPAAAVAVAGTVAAGVAVGGLVRTRLAPLAVAWWTGFRARHASAGLVTGSTWMLAGTAAVSVGSFVFWILAARTTSADAVGHASALFSSVFFLTYATSLGLPVAASRYAAADAPTQVARLRRFGILTIASSALGAVVFAWVAPADVVDPIDLGGRPVAALIAFVMVAGVSVSILVDVALMGRGRYTDVFWRSVAITVVRIVPFAVVPANDDGLVLFAVATGSYAVTSLAYLPSLLRPGTTEVGPAPLRGEVARFAAVNYLSQLAVQAPFYVTPLVVAVAVSTEDNAEFYLSWGIMSVVFIGIQVIGQALLVEGSRPLADRASHVRTALIACLGLAVVATAGSWVASNVAAALYGPSFDEVATILPWLVTGTVPWALSTVALADARIRGATRATLAVTIGFATLVLSGVGIGVAVDGTLGAARGWLLGGLASVVVSVPLLLRSLRLPPPDRDVFSQAIGTPAGDLESGKDTP